MLPEFPFASSNARFIGNPIDFVVFDGYTQVKDEKGDTINVVLVEVKKGKTHAGRDDDQEGGSRGKVSWRTIFLKDEEMGESGRVQ
jgi:predicted Holliday junction resolvase-like endonuclease